MKKFPNIQSARPSIAGQTALLTALSLAFYSEVFLRQDANFAFVLPFFLAAVVAIIVGVLRQAPNVTRAAVIMGTVIVVAGSIGSVMTERKLAHKAQDAKNQAAAHQQQTAWLPTLTHTADCQRLQFPDLWGKCIQQTTTTEADVTECVRQVTTKSQALLITGFSPETYFDSTDQVDCAVAAVVIRHDLRACATLLQSVSSTVLPPGYFIGKCIVETRDRIDAQTFAQGRTVCAGLTTEADVKECNSFLGQ